MYLADTLSRAPPQQNSSNEVLSIRSTSLENICRQSQQDSSIKALQKVIENVWPETKNNLCHQIKPHFNVYNQLSVEDGIVSKGDQCLVLISLGPEVPCGVHRSHIDIKGCPKHARESVYWPRMTVPKELRL